MRIINKKRLIEFLEHCKRIHQSFVDRPEWCNKQVGNVEHHEKYVRKYQESVNVARKLRVVK